MIVQIAFTTFMGKRELRIEYEDRSINILQVEAYLTSEINWHSDGMYNITHLPGHEDELCLACVPGSDYTDYFIDKLMNKPVLERLLEMYYG